MLLVALFLYQSVRFWETMSFRRYLVLSLLFAFTLWAKLTTPPFVLFSLALFSLNSLPAWKIGLQNTATIGSVGTAAFLVTWLVYCYIAQVPLLYPVERTFLGKKAKYLHLGARLWSFEMLGVTVAFLATLGLLVSIQRSLRPPRPMAELLFIFVGVILFVYTIWVHGGLKYLTVALPPLCVLFAPFVTNRLRSLPRPALFLSAAVLYYLIHLVPLLIPLGLSLRTNRVQAVSAALILAIGLLMAQGAKHAFRGYPPARSFTQLASPVRPGGGLLLCLRPLPQHALQLPALYLSDKPSRFR